MSLKSFDKFCENLILAEPGSKRDKEVFDERQKQIRLRLGIEAMAVCLIAILVNSVFSESFVRWSEHQFSAIFLIIMLSLLYWAIRSAVKGCLVAVDNKRAQKGSSIMMIFIFGLNLLRYLVTIFDEGIYTSDGILSDDFVFTLTLVVGVLCGVFSLCAIRRAEKSSESEESK